MRPYLLALTLLLFSPTASAAFKPDAQISLGNNQVLRGNFSEIREIRGMTTPFIASGHFVVAPGFGLIWGVEKPMPTSTIVTPSVVMQDIGGFAIRLPAKNLRHLFDMVGGAIAGDWTKLESDFVLKPGGGTDRWQMTLTPNGNSKTPYTSIVMTGGRFVENIVMTKNDETRDSFTFSNETLSAMPLTRDETRLFQEVKQP